jgi:hypothetical protein
VHRFFGIIFCEWGWLGFILTAFALSLGAPFWFGVLNKLVQLRASGPKPEDDTSELAKGTITPANQPAVKDIPLPPEEDMVAVVRIYSDAIRREPGVLNVGAGYIMVNGQVQQCLTVHVANDDAAVAIRSKYKTLQVSQGVEFLVDVQVTGETIIMAGPPHPPNNPNFGVANQTMLHGTGSYGCVVNDSFIKNNLYLLTCFHVANGDDSWTVTPVSKNIIDTNNAIIGRDFRYSLNEFHDTAIIAISPAIAAHYKALKKITKKPRDIDSTNVLKTRVFLDGFMNGGESGLIVNHSWPEKFTYLQDRDSVKITNHMTDLLKIERVGGPGDSGSILVDKNDNPVGMLIGSDEKFTYAIKINTILGDFGLEMF